MAGMSGDHYQLSPAYSLEAELEILLQKQEEKLVAEDVEELRLQKQEEKLVAEDDKERPAKRAKISPAKTQEEVEKAMLNSVPEETQQDTAYCMCVWNEWCVHT